MLSSRKVAEFLKNYSSTVWPRMLKAMVILGIQDLERRVAGITADPVFAKGDKKSLHLLFTKDIEDLVIRNEEGLI